MNIRISKESDVPLRRQIAAQIEFLIGTGDLKPGEPLPSVRALARQLHVHHNTVSQAYQDVTAGNLLTSKRGTRSIVRAPEERPSSSRPELDDLINHAIRAARHYGYTLQQLSGRVRERLLQETPDHVLVLSMDAGMQRILKAEVEQALKCPVEARSPAELLLTWNLSWRIGSFASRSHARHCSSSSERPPRNSNPVRFRRDAPSDHWQAD